MASVKRIVSRTYAIVTVLVVLVGGATGQFVYAMAEDARQAAEAVPQDGRAPPLPPQPQEQAALGSSTKTWPQDLQKGLKWVQRGDNAAVAEMTDMAILDYRTGLGYLEDSGGCQSTMAKAVREKIANLQKKPYDFPCTADDDSPRGGG
jgi:hypothetical protein